MDNRYLGSIFRLFLTGVTIGYYPTPTTEMSAGRSWCTEVGGGCEAGSAVQGKRRGLCGAALFAGAPSEWPYFVCKQARERSFSMLPLSVVKFCTRGSTGVALAPNTRTMYGASDSIMELTHAAQIQSWSNLDGGARRDGQLCLICRRGRAP